jgi:hypothetical protein
MLRLGILVGLAVGAVAGPAVAAVMAERVGGGSVHYGVISLQAGLQDSTGPPSQS